MAERLTFLEHAALARRLIDNLGGPKRAARHCRVGESDLSLYQNPNRPDRIMPADVISALQIHGGSTEYSDALSAEVDQPTHVSADPMHHACGLIRDASDALLAIERAVADGVISNAEFTICETELADLEARIPIIRAGLRAKLSDAVRPLRAA